MKDDAAKISQNLDYRYLRSSLNFVQNTQHAE